MSPEAARDPSRAHDPLHTVRDGLRRAALLLQEEGVPVPASAGKLLRPVVAYALVPPERRHRLDDRFWSGALAVQMVHEASLLHDDILDDAVERRGKKTLASARGVAPALVLGDHYLTGAYRAAASTGSVAFLTGFIRAVERTVAGEVAQAQGAGRRLAPGEYMEIITGKSGELFGATALLGGALLGTHDLEERVALGCDLGALYQQVDDLLDYCPAADTGKPPLQDYRQHKWTWILQMAGVEDFSASDEDILDRVFDRSGGMSPARTALARLRLRRDALVESVARLSPGDTIVAHVLNGWIDAATSAVSAQEAVRSPSAPTPHAGSSGRIGEVADLARAVGGPSDWPAYFGRHAKTFRFAARLFPAEQAAQVAGVYAFCRFTDDLVDEPHDGAPNPVVIERLAAWEELSREAHGGARTGIPLLDHVLGDSGRSRVEWLYPQALLRGVGMDLTRSRYPDWHTLELYTFGVAGAVGGWITQLFGHHDPALLEQAHALGHGMQLTNIVRDVGEDLERDRVYIPESLLSSHGVSVEELRWLRNSSEQIPDGYRRLLDEMMAAADAYYEQAWPGIQRLPRWYRRPVAVAAQAYRGIHDEVRRNGYDNLRQRAHTSLGSKVALAATGLFRARRGA